MRSTKLSPQLRPRKIPRQQRAEDTRARILDAARQVFEDNGYSHGTTNRIAAVARLSVGSLYQYFPNKDAILVELIDDHIDAGTAAVEAAIVDVLGPALDPTGVPLEQLVGAVVAAMVELHATDRGLHRVLFEEAPRPPELLARLRTLERDLTDRVAALLQAHREVTVADSALAARLVVDVIESLVHRIATDDASGIADDLLTEEITRMVIAYLTEAGRGAAR